MGSLHEMCFILLHQHWQMRRDKCSKCNIIKSFKSVSLLLYDASIFITMCTNSLPVIGIWHEVPYVAGIMLQIV